MISKIQRVKLREVWKHEANDFTTWLQDNIDVLNDALDVSLSNVEREQDAGTFSVDLVAEDQNGDTVIIENQLEKSDHDHLGKVITYLTSLEAKTAIWIVAEPRPEHVRAISWLNEATSARFYLAKVEAIKIDDSPPAPLITLITGPSVEASAVGKKKKDLAERHILRRKFWTALLAQAKLKTKLHANISPSDQNWVGTSAALPSGVYLSYIVLQHEVRVEFYFGQDQGAGTGYEQVFNTLLADKESIEREFGSPLEWDPADGKKSCRIKKSIEGHGYLDEEGWPSLHEKLIDAMMRLDQAIRPRLKSMQASS